MSTVTPKSKAGGATEHAANNLASSSSGDKYPTQNNHATLQVVLQDWVDVFRSTHPHWPTQADSNLGDDTPPRSKAGGATEHASSDPASNSLGATMPPRDSVGASPTKKILHPSAEQLAHEAKNTHLNAQLAVAVAAQMTKQPYPPPPRAMPPGQVYGRSQVPPPAGGASEHGARQQLTTLDMGTLDIMTRFCATSPMAQHNQIAVTNRYLNIAWRRMHRNVAGHMMRQLLSTIHDWTQSCSHDARARASHDAPAAPNHATFCFNGNCSRGYGRQQIMEFACEDLSDILF